MADLENKLKNRFWEKVNQKTFNDCWFWQAYIRPNGYGEFYFNGQMVHAHRVAYILTYGKIPKGIYVCHSCDNKNCCNPNHLFLGTHLDNMQDKVKKGRQVKGENIITAKLTEEQVCLIRTNYKPYKMTQKKIAKQFGVAPRTIGHITKNETWKGIK